MLLVKQTAPQIKSFLKSEKAQESAKYNGIQAS